MLAYAAKTRPWGRSESPKALVLIVAGHALLLGALFMTRMDIAPLKDDPTDVIFVPNPPKPPPPTPVDDPQTPTRPVTTIDQPRVIVPPVVPQPGFDPGPVILDVTPYAGPIVAPPYVPPITPRADPVKVAPRFITPDSLLRPPYPLSKIRSEEEASLRLRLAIDPRGRVTSVDPVGSADPEFLAAARRHILKAWRYKPATEGGTAISSSLVITLKFRLDQA